MDGHVSVTNLPVICTSVTELLSNIVITYRNLKTDILEELE